MHILIGILLAVGGAIWWWARRNPEDAIFAAKDAATVVRNAPRKIAFRRQHNQHPVEGIDDPRLAVAALGHAFIGLDDLPTKEARGRLNVALRKTYRLSEEDAVELHSLSQWLLEQCGGATAAITRIGRRLYKIDQSNSWDDLGAVLENLMEGEMSERQVEAVSDLKLALHIR